MKKKKNLRRKEKSRKNSQTRMDFWRKSFYFVAKTRKEVIEGRGKVQCDAKKHFVNAKVKKEKKFSVLKVRALIAQRKLFLLSLSRLISFRRLGRRMMKDWRIIRSEIKYFGVELKASLCFHSMWFDWVESNKSSETWAVKTKAS